MMLEGLRPIRCQSCGKLICEADGTVAFRCPRCKRKNASFELRSPLDPAAEKGQRTPLG